jgi:hypothetical protein
VNTDRPGQAFIDNRKKVDPTFEVYESDITTILENGVAKNVRYYYYKRRKCDISVTRIQSLNATIGEQWYLRLLMNILIQFRPLKIRGQEFGLQKQKSKSERRNIPAVHWQLEVST